MSNQNVAYNDIYEELRKGWGTAFVRQSVISDPVYRPRFVSNDPSAGRKVISSISEELRTCKEFAISVAFVTMGGLAPLLMELKELEKKGVKGRVLTTDYLSFSEPKAMDKLASFSNIELRIYQAGAGNEGFHTKGYLFKQDKVDVMILGSSNMTAAALTTNKEWNARLVSTEDGELVSSMMKEFEALWGSEKALAYSDIIESYRIRYQTVKKQREIVRKEELPDLAAYRLQPNKMQVEFLGEIGKLRDKDADRALLVSATGTGKTYASAFALRDELKPEKALFVVHREQIAKQAMASFRKVYGSTKSFGLVSGNSKGYDCDMIFATMQTMSRKDVMGRFAPDHFDVIVIDEVHRAGAPSYQRIMEHFKPKFWLGMTASPERTDGFDIYELFDHNIACEIRLQQALEEDFLCPFHYFGITDISVDGRIITDDKDLRGFSDLVSDQRVDHIIEEAEYYGHSGDRVKGLVFCSRRNEADELSRRFNERGYRTVSLGGDDPQSKREECIDRLISDDTPDPLDYIFTVDIFNEGVDIPPINQVIMLRPTESPIVFVQQLGRGLRKWENKDYVVILDFIGNYANNFMIPIALSGDRTYSKDNMRKYVMEGANVIPGCSTIHFDEIAKRQIFNAIDKVTTPLKFLKEKYFNLRNRLGRMPFAEDFYRYGEIDPILFIDYKKTSYYSFVRKVDADHGLPVFTAKEEKTLDFISTQLANGKRPHELMILDQILKNGYADPGAIEESLAKYDVPFREKDYDSAVRFLRKDFLNTQADKAKYAEVDLIRDESGRIKSSDLLRMSHDGFKKCAEDLVRYGLLRFNDYYSDPDEDNLVLYQKYSRRDACRILNWDKDDSSTVYGYRIKHGTCPIFVTYEKKDDISETTKYEDQFIDPQRFSWMTRSRVNIDSAESQEIINYKKRGLKLYLFVKKSDDEGSDFYYMGRVAPVEYRQTTIKDKNGNDIPIMNFRMLLRNPVRSDIYDYFVRKEED